jgi:hypothetical protein
LGRRLGRDLLGIGRQVEVFGGVMVSEGIQNEEGHGGMTYSGLRVRLIAREGRTFISYEYTICNKQIILCREHGIVSHRCLCHRLGDLLARIQHAFRERASPIPTVISLHHSQTHVSHISLSRAYCNRCALAFTAVQHVLGASRNHDVYQETSQLIDKEPS